MKPKFVHEILNVLNETHGNLSASEAAQLSGRSVSRMRHVFTLAVGMSFRLARLQAKLAPAALLLRQSTLSIRAISAIVGYSDRTKFERAFKRVYGVTAKQYRRFAKAA